eukprot:m.284769 g.284769  ORF g.284769 m.284769 type:complete len:98 (+) comp54964_c1_seq105:206-499(+)
MRFEGLSFWRPRLTKPKQAHRSLAWFAPTAAAASAGRSGSSFSSDILFLQQLRSDLLSETAHLANALVEADVNLPDPWASSSWSHHQCGGRARCIVN